MLIVLLVNLYVYEGRLYANEGLSIFCGLLTKLNDAVQEMWLPVRFLFAITVRVVLMLLDLLS